MCIVCGCLCVQRISRLFRAIGTEWRETNDDATMRQQRTRHLAAVRRQSIRCHARAPNGEEGTEGGGDDASKVVCGDGG